ncbi:hypothetical protein AVEN_221843-1 [Araneus ventricosus]|uniref:Uncharacterized protein n=1 Tax=Araneus ventricosus TaxID=182803 RepID=A0A4Y2FTM0_ARAVE|nr:hypothetical protein AVEN_221843-1 [Araneus ventricosus]
MTGKSFTEVLLQAKPMNPDLGDKFGHFGNKTKLLENSRAMVLSLQGTKLQRTFVRLLCDVASCQKRYQASYSNEELIVLGALTAVQAGEMTDIECY